MVDLLAGWTLSGQLQINPLRRRSAVIRLRRVRPRAGNRWTLPGQTSRSQASHRYSFPSLSSQSDLSDGLAFHNNVDERRSKEDAPGLAAVPLSPIDSAIERNKEMGSSPMGKPKPPDSASRSAGSVHYSVLSKRRHFYLAENRTLLNGSDKEQRITKNTKNNIRLTRLSLWGL